MLEEAAAQIAVWREELYPKIGVTAEGGLMETAAIGQAKLLRLLGCPYGQGYLFGRPARAADMRLS